MAQGRKGLFADRPQLDAGSRLFTEPTPLPQSISRNNCLVALRKRTYSGWVARGSTLSKDSLRFRFPVDVSLPFKAADPRIRLAKTVSVGGGCGFRELRFVRIDGVVRQGSAAQ